MKQTPTEPSKLRKVVLAPVTLVVWVAARLKRALFTPPSEKQARVAEKGRKRGILRALRGLEKDGK